MENLADISEPQVTPNELKHQYLIFLYVGSTSIGGIANLEKIIF